MTDGEVIQQLRTDSPLTRARWAFSVGRGEIVDAMSRPNAAGPIELRRMELKVAQEIGEAFGFAALVAERDRLRTALTTLRSRMDQRMGDTDPSDPEDPDLLAMQAASAASRRPEGRGRDAGRQPVRVRGRPRRRRGVAQRRRRPAARSPIGMDVEAVNLSGGRFALETKFGTRVAELGDWIVRVRPGRGVSGRGRSVPGAVRAVAGPLNLDQTRRGRRGECPPPAATVGRHARPADRVRTGGVPHRRPRADALGPALCRAAGPPGGWPARTCTGRRCRRRTRCTACRSPSSTRGCFGPGRALRSPRLRCRGRRRPRVEPGPSWRDPRARIPTAASALLAPPAGPFAIPGKRRRR